ncbi:bifunctional precorrin-2 dehydrogenase/sirohydrochlorin ferrochelatase [Geothrix sp. PMB-07]|uniref:precorrin-2 dehydrogenase/sirohydrochlorin ferrochelatase family protein n=1 Tax=Geothrix sp. PMB-07 TaxID=3068640 RepID=UPI002741FA2C|nr:bifunctional precorrin-2 dehydrogenase/sirohydrochlorin ferrochelatase [Geothrix sp. PMB-07]WLT31193.1 bifunctional precorrin-2 dehydrogenase/sirohydrochlorin ferrochelatase [Geothrix sp. PMB-07]
MTLLPLFLDLKEKQVLLVGGGSVAQAKLRSLLPTGVTLRAVATRFSADFRLEAEGHPVHLLERPFEAGDLDGTHLVVSATNDPEANARIASQARQRGIWINAVDDPPSCDALFASTLRRGPWTLAISTEGAFAGLSRALRLALEDLIPDDPDLQALVDLRQQARRLPPEVRSRALQKLLADFRTAYFPSPRPSTPELP